MKLAGFKDDEKLQLWYFEAIMYSTLEGIVGPGLKDLGHYVWKMTSNSEAVKGVSSFHMNLSKLIQHVNVKPQNGNFLCVKTS